MIHEGFLCDICNEDGVFIEGSRYHCLTCGDFDLCQKHYKDLHKHHFVDHRFVEFRTPGGKGSRAEHRDFLCDNCKQIPKGIRFQCLNCENYDLCEVCYFKKFKAKYIIDHPKGHNFEAVFNPVQPQKKKKAVHKGVICDKCDNDKWIVGTRYKCLHCHDYDLCPKHFKISKKIHPKNHIFRALKSPLMGGRPPNTPLANDTIGIIVSYLRSPSEFFAVCLVSKDVRQYLTKSKSVDVSRYIEFVYRKSLSTRDRYLEYVYRLTLRNKPLSKNTLNKFINLRNLTLTRCTGIGIKKSIQLPVFKYLEKLVLEGTNGISGTDLKKFTTLKCLDIDEATTNDRPVIKLGEWIKNFKNLERLSIVGCLETEKFWDGLKVVGGQLSKFVFQGSTYSYDWFNADSVLLTMSNLEKLELRGNRVVVTSEGMKSMTCLRHLIIHNCRASSKESFEELPNLQDLQIFMYKLAKRRRMKGKVARN